MEIKEDELKLITETVDAVLNEHEKNRENLIPILQKVQSKLGYLPAPAMEKVSDSVGVPAVDVHSMATFYNQFRLNPPGDNEIKVCMGTACYMVGGQNTLDSFERRLDIKKGETTADRKFSLERVACVGCCTLAPVVVVNENVESHVTPTKVDGIMLSFENNGEHIKKNDRESTGQEGDKTS